jgi:hypothetical protein
MKDSTQDSGLPEEPGTKVPGRVMSRIMRWIFYTSLVLISLPIILWMLIQLPYVQRWGIEKLEKLVWSEYQAKLSIQSFSLSFSDLVSLEEVAFFDPAGDTILVADELKLSLGSNLLTLLNNSIYIDGIYLSGASLYYRMLENGKDNFAFLAGNRKRQKSGTRFHLNVKHAYLQDFEFILDDRRFCNAMHAYIERGEVEIRKTDINEIAFEIHKASFLRPDVTFTVLPKAYHSPVLVDTAAADEEYIPMSADNFRIMLDKINIRQGKFALHNLRSEPTSPAAPNSFDPYHIRMENMEADVEAFRMHGRDMEAIICHLQFTTPEGFVLNKMQTGDFHWYQDEMAFSDLRIETPGSVFTDRLRFSYADFGDFSQFVDLVSIQAGIGTGKLAMKDLFYFAPQLRQNTFFKKYSNESIEISGNINGRINSLRGNNLNVNFANQARYQGSFASRSLTDPLETILNLDIQSLETDMLSLRQLLPGLALPDNFNKLGRIRFKGKFDGFYEDFVTYGRLTSALGVADLDMKLNTQGGVKKASYSGGLVLYNFDLKRWTGNEEFGNLSARLTVSNGKGLTLETIRANLNARIDRLQFKNYDYQNVQFTGMLNKDLLDGQVIANDENMQLDFLGSIDFSGEAPILKFNSKIDLLDLGALNLSKEPFSFSGDFAVDAIFKDISNIDGTLMVRNLILARSDLHFLHLGDSRLESRYLGRKEKMFSFDSEIGKLEINGEFNFQHIWGDILTVFSTKNKQFARKWKLPVRDSLYSNNHFDFDLRISNTKNLAEVLNLPIDTIKNLRFSGFFENTRDGRFQFDIRQFLAPKLRYGNIQLEGLIVKASGSNANSEMIFHMDQGTLFGVPLQITDALINLTGDTIAFNLGTENVLKSFEQLGVVGKYFLVDGRNHIEFRNMEFTALDRRWEIQSQNFIQFTDSLLYARNMLFSDGDAYVNFSSYDDLGLHCQVNNIDLALFNNLLDSAGYEFQGKVRADLYVRDFLKFQEMSGNATIKDFVANDIPLGDLRVLAEQKNFEHPIYLDVTALENNQAARAEGYFYLPSAYVPEEQNRFAFNGTFRDYSLAIGDVFLKGIFSGTEGKVSGGVTIAGDRSIHTIDGTLTLSEASTRLDYLGTRYRVRSAPVKLTNDFIDFGEMEILDESGNPAKLRGGIRHRYFNDMDITLRVSSPLFQALNTTQKDNELFYGKAFGKLDLRMSGPFKNLDININAETGPNTVVAIPLNSAIDDREQSFIVFTNTKEEADSLSEVKPIEGLNLQMFLTITPVAELQLIFDERTGEIIKGRGNGNIQIDLPRDGEFQMYGDFEIEKGEYPFKAFVVLDKAFSIKRGGTISWYGDPLNAFINLQAEYKGLRTSPYNFIYDYIRNDNNLLDEAKRPTDVDLTLNLNGQLLEPRIQFDLAFPSLQGELKNYTENRLRTLAVNPDELNMTAVSLLAFKGFLPQTADILSTAAISNTVSSTLTEWVTNQMRVFINEYLIDSLTKNGLVSDLNLDFGIILNPAISVDGQPSVAGLAQSQFYLRPQFQFLDNRVTLDMGLTTFGNVTNGGRVGGEFNVEYAFGESRRLRAKAYAQNQPLINDNRIVSGIGLAYRREYNSFREIFGKQKSGSAKSPNSDRDSTQKQPALPEKETPGLNDESK